MPDVHHRYQTPPATPVAERLIPLEAGEGAIYSPEYLARKEERTHGVPPKLMPLDHIY